MKHKLNQQGLIPLLITVLVVVLGVIIFAYLRLKSAQ